jgi:hypothetical protein
VIVAAVELMGGIDLDPYCIDETTTLIPAKHHYSTDEDALAHPWGAGTKRLRVFLSPPTGRATAAWVNKLCDEYEAGSVAQAILYLRAALDTDWWQRLMTYPICIVRRQLRDAAGKHSTTSPWAVVYLGPNLKGFAEAFSEVGTLYAPFKRQPPLAEPEPTHKPAHVEHPPTPIKASKAAKPAREKSGSGVQTFQQGDYEVTVHPTACYLTLANPYWDTRDQLRLRKAILDLPDMLPRQYSRVSQGEDGSIKLVFSFKQGQHQKIASRVKKLLVDPSGKADRPAKAAR